MPTKNRRSRILIEPYKQLRFGLAYIGLNMVFAILMVSVFGYYMWDMFVAIRFYFVLSNEESAMTLAKFALPASIALALCVAFIACTLIFSARFTHQFYGPLVSIRRFLDDMISGARPALIHIRKTDQLQDVVERLNLLTGATAEDNANYLAVLDKVLDDLLEKKNSIELEWQPNNVLYPIVEKMRKLAKGSS